MSERPTKEEIEELRAMVKPGGDVWSSKQAFALLAEIDALRKEVERQRGFYLTMSNRCELFAEKLREADERERRAFEAGRKWSGAYWGGSMTWAYPTFDDYKREEEK